MDLISRVVKPDYLPTKEDIFGIIIIIANFPIFTQIDPLDVLEYYLSSCIQGGVDPLVDPFNLPETYPNAYGKRKKSSKKKVAQGEGTSESPKKKKVEMVLDDMPLSELQKATILKDTFGVAYQYS